MKHSIKQSATLLLALLVLLAFPLTGFAAATSATLTLSQSVPSTNPTIESITIENPVIGPGQETTLVITARDHSGTSIQQINAQVNIYDKNGKHVLFEGLSWNTKGANLYTLTLSYETISSYYSMDALTMEFLVWGATDGNNKFTLYDVTMPKIVLKTKPVSGVSSAKDKPAKTDSSKADSTDSKEKSNATVAKTFDTAFSAAKGGKATAVLKNQDLTKQDAATASKKAASKKVKTTVQLDSIQDKKLQSRIVLPLESAGDGLKSGVSTDSKAAKKASTTFEAKYTNIVSVFALNQTTALKANATIYYRLPDKTTLSNPVVYRYNAEKNTLTLLDKSKASVDKNGYLSFTADPYGIFIVSDGTLEK